MLSLPAPEDTRVQHIQQMHIVGFFQLQTRIFSCYMDETALAIVWRGWFRPRFDSL
jgi:hypothetical protein